MPIRTAWTVAAVAAVALALAAGSWLLNRSAEAPTSLPPTQPAPPSATLLGTLLQPIVDAKADAATQPASAATPAALPPSLRTPASSTPDELRTVQLALEEGATPAQARKAADVLERCEHATQTIEFAYSVRDQGGPLRQVFEKTPGFNMDQWIKEKQDLQRRCQFFDTATLARRGEFLKRAYEGELPGMALAYLLWLNAHANQAVAAPELLGKLQREVRQTAEDGDLEALSTYVHSFGALGETAMQRQAYKEAWLRILTEMSGPAATKESRDSMENVEKMMRQGRWAPPALSADEQRETDALTERVVDAWRKRH